MKMTFSFAVLVLLTVRPVIAQQIDEVRVKANANDAEAQYLLGEAYRTGRSAVADRDMAIAWFRRSAAQGNTRAADMLGQLLFSKGEWQEAVPLLENAATRRDPQALYILAIARINGDGVIKDIPRGYAEMRAAAKQGLPQAMDSLQIIEGFITDEDRAKALTIQIGVHQ